MNDMSYNRVSSVKCKGFRLNLRKLYVLRLCKRFTFFLRIFDKWKVSYGEAVKVLKKVFRRKSGFKRNNSNNSRSDGDCRVTSYVRHNSFYAEAIADCLEFIKRTSISSMDQIEDQDGHIQERNS
ncbi:PREDICTED: uncharacterized protein LOC109349849 [Lupinus angustifolius]|uniref:uncharacterized protein LOC109349849 n=1 Tax=Lupinus angustifolius TaxID=3871 RepID=UPI00092EAB79|nr:PREDICTED: uncharacterized protein LOC109349849 [Lupinus angustifolius]